MRLKREGSFLWRSYFTQSFWCRLAGLKVSQGMTWWCCYKSVIWPLIGREWSLDLNTGLWLAESDHVTWMKVSQGMTRVMLLQISPGMSWVRISSSHPCQLRSHLSSVRAGVIFSRYGSYIQDKTIKSVKEQLQLKLQQTLRDKVYNH